MSKAKKVCEICGKELTVRQKKFCSDACRKQVPKVSFYTKTCPECNEEFKTNEKNQKCCSKACSKKHCKPIRGHGALDRPYTHETAYLIRLWIKQGDSVIKIAEVLGRSIDNVKKALV